MLGQPIAGAGYLLRGFSLIGVPGIRRFVALPLGINALVFGLLIWLATDEFGRLINYLMPQLPGWLAWLAWLFWVVFALVVAVLVFFSFSIVANLIAAPFNGLLAEAVERHLTGAPPPGSESFMAALKDAPATIIDELRKVAYFVLWAIPLLILFFIPMLNLAAPILWALFSAWMLAVEYGDYPMGNHGMKGKEQRQRLRERRLLSLGFGGATLLATMVPLVNFLVMPTAVAGATALWVERLNSGKREA